MKGRSDKIKRISVVAITGLLSSCAPGPPPPPPPPALPLGFDWILLAVVVAGAAFLWRRNVSRDPGKTKYITDALNSINHQLKEIEKKIEALEKDQNQNQNQINK